MISGLTIVLIVGSILVIPFAALGVVYLAAYLVPNHMRAIRLTLRIPMGHQTLGSPQDQS
jgi:hypothetical protein